MRRHLGTAAVGLLLGGVLTRLGFWDFREVHRMFLLRDVRLLLAFAGAVAIVAVGFALTPGGRPRMRRRVTAGVLGGAALFGAGWALTGACPGAALVQLANGYLPALATLGGIVAGMSIERFARGRWIEAESDSCGE